jgi:hypothetical protein
MGRCARSPSWPVIAWNMDYMRTHCSWVRPPGRRDGGGHAPGEELGLHGIRRCQYLVVRCREWNGHRSLISSVVLVAAVGYCVPGSLGTQPTVLGTPRLRAGVARHAADRTGHPPANGAR